MPFADNHLEILPGYNILSSNSSLGGPAALESREIYSLTPTLSAILLQEQLLVLEPL